MTSQPISISRGETVAVGWTLTPVVDITGWTLLLTVAKRANSSGGKVLQVPVSVTSGPAGTFGVTLISADTRLLEPGTYAWDVWRNDPGQERLLASGAFVVSRNARFPV